MTVVVVAGVVVESGRVLVTQRPEGSHLAGLWEFPGGKVEPDEDPRDALVRELREELGVETSVEPIVDVTFHRYPGKSVLLLFYEAVLLATSPRPRCLGVADIAWKAAAELHDESFPAADVKVLSKVRALLTERASRVSSDGEASSGADG